jgi:UDP-3-O-[3-hydroxymyristoyl] glucosamine N-acyltransferase
MLAGQSGVTTDIPSGARYGGSPAEPFHEAVATVVARRRPARRARPPEGGGR